ncbi:unnamed protein product [Cylicostephanus goldi]|uniref:Uncharacterized protein n=1 Tax=Cylicostephanus goldi TaxID=71465 RepID=A0A3P6S2J3_CYLGO|nr:unnamed protein product [Cylicostephanus goldi]
MVALRKRIRAVQERDGFCTFLVERPSSLHHVTNPSCAAMKPAGIPADGIIMGDDAIEIGAREAFKYARVKNKQVSMPPRHFGSSYNGKINFGPKFSDLNLSTP